MNHYFKKQLLGIIMMSLGGIAFVITSSTMFYGFVIGVFTFNIMNFTLTPDEVKFDER